MASVGPIHGERLVLRPFRPDDASDLQHLAGAGQIAATTLGIPHPYPEGAAEEWIARQAADPAMHHFAITLLDAETLIGAIGLDVEGTHHRAELGYWVGVPYWGKGYATEAARMVVAYAFDTLHLHRVYAFHFTNNPASGAVLRKVGMTYEGTRRGHTYKADAYLDSEGYAILRSARSDVHGSVDSAAG
jgi:RimJ/RimL family protein N-acetyltransferase